MHKQSMTDHKPMIFANTVKTHSKYNLRVRPTQTISSKKVSKSEINMRKSRSPSKKHPACVASSPSSRSTLSPSLHSLGRKNNGLRRRASSLNFTESLVISNVIKRSASSLKRRCSPFRMRKTNLSASATVFQTKSSTEVRMQPISPICFVFV